MHVKKSLLVAMLCFSAIVLQLLSVSTASATTKWWKIASSSCAVSVTGNDLVQTIQYSTGSVAINDEALGGLNIYLYCAVELPQGVSANKLRIRTFNGLPQYTDIQVSLNRRKWDGSSATIATANLDQGNTYADADFTLSVDNESYHYLLSVYLYKSSSATVMPQLDMIEIRYDE